MGEEGEWGQIINIISADYMEDGSVSVYVEWDGGMSGKTNCRIMSYCTTDPHTGDGLKAYKKELKKHPVRLSALKLFLARSRGLKIGDKVQTSQSKFNYGFGRSKREWGTISKITKPLGDHKDHQAVCGLKSGTTGSYWCFHDCGKFKWD